MSDLIKSSVTLLMMAMIYYVYHSLVANVDDVGEHSSFINVLVIGFDCLKLF